MAWTLHDSASAHILKLGTENCKMHLPVCCSLSTSAVMQRRMANNGEKTLIQKLITLLNKPQSALENDSVAHLFETYHHLHRIMKNGVCMEGEQIFINE